MAAPNPAYVYRKYEVDGVPDSGAHNPKKAEIIQLLSAIIGGTASIGDFRGGWDAGAAYIARDIVEKNGSLWWALVANTNVTPVEGATWTLLLPGATVADGAITEVKLASSLQAKLVGMAATRSALSALSGATYAEVNLTEAGRKGLFYWDGSDLSGTLLGPAITTTSVNSTTETATKAAHGLFTGQPVVVTTAVNGLAVNTIYYAIRVTIDTFRLATSFANAVDEVAFNFTGTTNFTVKRHYDSNQGVYITPSANASGTAGAWVRQMDGDLFATWFGLTALGDKKDNTGAINMAIILADRLGREISLPGYQFDVYAGPNGGVALFSNTRIKGQGRSTILNAIGGGSASQLRNYQAGAVFRRHFNFTNTTDTNVYVNFASIERLAIVLNHPSASVTTTDIQIAVDFRNVTRSRVRDCWVGNYHPVTDAKGFTRPFLAQGYGIVTGNESGATPYAGGEVNVIEDNFIAGLWRAICIDDNLLTPVSAAYSQRIERNDISVASVLIFQGSQYGAANVIRHNVLQATQARSGSAHPDGAIMIEGYGNLIEEIYGEYGTDCPFILRFGGQAHENRAKYSGTCSVTGGLVTEGGHYGFRDSAGSSSHNIIEFFADSSGGGGAFLAHGTPQRMISGTATTQT